MKHHNAQAYKTISIIGSFRKQMKDIQKAKETFLSRGFNVLVPTSTNISSPNSASFVLLDTDPDKTPKILEYNYLNALLESDIVYCCNADGYIGGTAMFELGFLIAKGQEVFFQEPPTEDLIRDLINNKYHICTPERLCDMLLTENALWASREWFDANHKYEPDFSFEKE